MLEAPRNQDHFKSRWCQHGPKAHFTGNVETEHIYRHHTGKLYDDPAHDHDGEKLPVDSANQRQFGCRMYARLSSTVSPCLAAALF